ncbi:hypothetical protein LCGC14_1162500 [marine sediment metagenome]|uniref:Phosphoadenosine phosphosulphate reductase domain-containing protein n=1 Tax=marine sediment metagenome TaxID=412755 RepID=A0A0F9MF83_9ZZZZ
MRVKDFSKRKLVGKVLQLGAGRQSSGIVEMIVEGDLPPVDLVVFADTGDEPQWVYDQVSYLQKRLGRIGIPLTIALQSIGICEAIKSGERFASVPMYTGFRGQKKGILRRQCTHEYKIIPAQDVVLNWLLERGHAKRRAGDGVRRVSPKVYIEQWYGIATDEMYRAKERGANWQKCRYPLIEIGFSTEHTLDYIKGLGLPVPKKSSCRICPYHDDEHWLDLKVNHPEDFEHACLFDEWLRSDAAKLTRIVKGMRQEVWLHPSCIPLREVDFAERIAKKKSKISAIQLRLFDEELAFGTCGGEGAFSCFS